MIERIVTSVAAEHGVCPLDIMGTARTRPVSKARREVMTRLNNRGWTPYRISVALGMHHTSVYYAMGKLAKNPKF